MTVYYMTQTGADICAKKLLASAGDTINITVDGEPLLLEPEIPPMRDRQLEILRIVSDAGFGARWDNISPFFAECALIGHRWILGRPTAPSKFEVVCEFCGFII